MPLWLQGEGLQMNFWQKKPNDIRKFCESVLGKEDTPLFAEWAFGKGYETDLIFHLWARWNKLHGYLYQLEGRGDPKKDIPEMIRIWKEQKKLWT
jgi:hypothetical protein